MDAILVGSDEASDIAVLKVEGTNFPALTMSRNELRVGEPVLAIGSPLALIIRHRQASCLPNHEA